MEYTKQVFIIYLNFKFNWASSAVSGDAMWVGRVREKRRTGIGRVAPNGDSDKFNGTIRGDGPKFVLP